MRSGTEAWSPRRTARRAAPGPPRAGPRRGGPARRRARSSARAGHPAGDPAGTADRASSVHRVANGEVAACEPDPRLGLRRERRQRHAGPRGVGGARAEDLDGPLRRRPRPRARGRWTGWPSRARGGAHRGSRRPRGRARTPGRRPRRRRTRTGRSRGRAAPSRPRPAAIRRDPGTRRRPVGRGARPRRVGRSPRGHARAGSRRRARPSGSPTAGPPRTPAGGSRARRTAAHRPGRRGRPPPGPGRGTGGPRRPARAPPARGQPRPGSPSSTGARAGRGGVPRRGLEPWRRRDGPAQPPAPRPSRPVSNRAHARRATRSPEAAMPAGGQGVDPRRGGSGPRPARTRATLDGDEGRRPVPVAGRRSRGPPHRARGPASASAWRPRGAGVHARLRQACEEGVGEETVHPVAGSAARDQAEAGLALEDRSRVASMPVIAPQVPASATPRTARPVSTSRTLGSNPSITSSAR